MSIMQNNIINLLDTPIINNIDDSKLHELLSLNIRDFNSIYIENIYNIIHEKNNTKTIYNFIKKYVITSKKKIIDCIKKNRFSIDELQKFISNIKTKFIFIKNIDKNFNDNINKIVFNNFIINPNVCMVIYKKIIENNVKFIYYLQKILKSNYMNNNIIFFQKNFIKYIFEDILLKINTTNNILNDYKLVYYYIKNNFYNFNLYSKLFNNIHFKNNIYTELLQKYNTELNNSNYMFIVNNIELYYNIIKIVEDNEQIIILKKNILEYTIGNTGFYNISVEKFVLFYSKITNYIIKNDKNFKLNIINIFQKNPKILEKFITHLILVIYKLIVNKGICFNSSYPHKYLIEIINSINILFDYSELFKIKFMNIFKNTNNIFLLDKLTQKNKVLIFNQILKSALFYEMGCLSEYIYNVYNDYYKSTNENININQYYWNINNNNYIKNKSSKKYNYLQYLHFGKTIINFKYKDNMINLTMLPIQYEMFKYFNEHNTFPKKLGNYSSDYLNKVIISFINSKLILYDNTTYTINSDFKQVHNNMIEVFYTNKIIEIKNNTRQHALEIKYVLATNINKLLKQKANDINGIYNFLKENLNIDIFNISKNTINNTLDYMIKQEYISKNENMYTKLLY